MKLEEKYQNLSFTKIQPIRLHDSGLRDPHTKKIPFSFSPVFPNLSLQVLRSMSSALPYLKKNINKSQCFSSNLRTKSMIKCTSYRNLRNLVRQLPSCKISYKIQNQPSITSSAAVSHVRSLTLNVSKASKISYSLYPLYSYL